MEYKENDFFDVTEAITELIRYLRSGNKKKIFEQMQKIIDETEKETEKYFNNIMELIGANIFLFLSGIPLDKESKDKITESFEQQIHVQSERKTKADYMKYWLEYIADNIQSMHNNDQNQLIQQIYKYLNDNFSQPIGLTNVSEHVNSRFYNGDFTTLHTNKCKGKCSLYICKQEKRDIGAAFIFLLNQISTLRDCEKQ